MANPTRHGSNLNNHYIALMEEVIEEAQSEGYYEVTYTDYVKWSSREDTKISVAAQTVCRRKKGVDFEWCTDTDNLQEYEWVEVNIYFSWE